MFLIKDYQRLKKIEQHDLGWDIKRILSKINYNIHTDAINTNLIPDVLTKKQVEIIYANEADIINLALFGTTAAEWHKENKNRTGNIRDYANIAQLVCLINLENLNSIYIQESIDSKTRLIKMNQIAIHQMKILTQDKRIQKLEYISKQNLIVTRKNKE